MRRLLVVVLLVWAVSAHGDDSAVYETAGAVAPMGNHPTVRMVREKVDAKLDLFSAQVRCEFVFKNEGPATTVKMGFPEQGYEYDPDGDKQSKPVKGSGYKGFRSWVDGKPVSTKFMFSYQGEFAPEYLAWSVKDVKFGAGQTRTVVNKYECQAFVLGEEFFCYVLRTGRNWKGKIGQAVITVDASELQRYWRVTPRSPKGAVVEASRITWVLKDFEPEEDVVLGIERKQRMFIGNPVSGTLLYDFDPEIYHKRGITVAPIRVLDSLGRISWNEVRRECTISYRDCILLLRPGSKTAILNGSEKIELPETPYIGYSSPPQFCVPILAVAKTLGMKIGYDAKTGDTSILGRQ